MSYQKVCLLVFLILFSWSLALSQVSFYVSGCANLDFFVVSPSGITYENGYHFGPQAGVAFGLENRWEALVGAAFARANKGILGFETEIGASTSSHLQIHAGIMYDIVQSDNGSVATGMIAGSQHNTSLTEYWDDFTFMLHSHTSTSTSYNVRLPLRFEIPIGERFSFRYQLALLLADQPERDISGIRLSIFDNLYLCYSLSTSKK